MSAGDHLSDVQFVGLRELAGYKAGDHDGTVGNGVGAHLVARQQDEPDERQRHQRVEKSVLKHGIREPLVVDRWKDSSFGPATDQLRDGHHRAQVALEHGISPVPVRFVTRN